MTRLSLRPRLGLSASLPCTATREPVASVNHWLVEREGRSLGLWTWPRLLEFFDDVTDATPTTEETKP